jgi:hypothetical protein
MKYRWLVVAGVLAVIAAFLTPVLRPSAQAPALPATGSVGRMPTYTPTYTPPQPATYNPPKTAWGDPDIAGVYDFMTFIRMERPAEYRDKKTLSAEELKAYFKKYAPNEDACGTGSREGEVCTPEEDAQVGDYNEFWDNRKWVPDNRSSLIVDPDNGMRPPYVPAFQAQLAGWQAARRARGPLDSWVDFGTVTRCISEQTPNGPQMYNSGTMIMQSPGWVMLIRERLDTRYIALDGRAHVDDKIQLWHGHSVGKWEGSTLVVDTTNYTGKQIMAGVGSTLPAGVPFDRVHLVERFVPVSATQINYYATVDAPTVWTRPWTFHLPWHKEPGYVIYEYACHEGDLSIENALRGERRLEAQRAEAARRGPNPNHSSALVGRTQAQVRAALGEPADTANTRWVYYTTNGNPLYVFYDKDVVRVVQPNDLPLADVKRAR